MAEGPRVYNLFPLLAGQISKWERLLPHIAGMKFDWIFLNPFHYPGFSGSLYAVKDPYALHPLVQGASRKSADELVQGFLTKAGRKNLRVMTDLVINHTAKDAGLAETHPEWYRKDQDGSLYSPRAVNPADPNDVTIWGDLAELDWHGPHRQDMIAYWQDYVRHMVKLGVDGFRCDAAYQVPAEVWAPLIKAAKQERADLVFFAETLGCTEDQVTALASAGFDFLFNSSKWWDYRAGWLLDQYDSFRHIAPSIAFPESHDTPRLAEEMGQYGPAELEACYRMRYAFSAVFSSGVMLPMGYEYGFGRKLHVVETRPEEWQEADNPRFDITGYVAQVNAMKAAVPALNVEGRQERITPVDQTVIGLLRYDAESAHNAKSCVVSLINPDPRQPADFDPARLFEGEVGRFANWQERTPDGPAEALGRDSRITVQPQQVRVFEARI